jgi:hypothetical protein
MLDVAPICAVAAKFNPVMLADVIVAVCVLGLNVNPALLGVTAYVPAANPPKLYAPELLALVVALVAPLKVTVAPLPPVAGVTAPEIPKVCAPGVWLTT